MRVYKGRANYDPECSQMIGGMPETVMVSADFINEVDKEVNYMGHLYWLEHEWFYGAKIYIRGSESFMVIFEFFYYCTLLYTPMLVMGPWDTTKAAR